MTNELRIPELFKNNKVMGWDISYNIFRLFRPYKTFGHTMELPMHKVHLRF